ncbi:fumarylacetoacetase [Variovorax humicola]|uniref:fumarylacetoacetase n=1 Tax=Variovorax humicola TaxID=1769758 RepID=A0ABU8W344_9BURK
MTTTLNHTHDVKARSWLESANAPGSDFPIQNLPFCVFRRQGAGDVPRCGIAIGDRIVDVAKAAASFTRPALEAAMACGNTTLNELMGLAPSTLSALRSQLFNLLSRGTTTGRDLIEAAMVPIPYADLLMPVRVGGYTDFFASIHHATNAGRLFRPDQPLLPNYKYVPVGYNGRAASIQIGKTPVNRPYGQLRKPGTDAPGFMPCEKLDHEVELGIFIGKGSVQGEPISVDDAWDHIFGVCLLNDWSARDVQAWEAQPLGPFLAKSFATGISPWIITAEALVPYRVQPAARPDGDPAPLPHLVGEADQALGAMHILIDAHLASQRMRANAQQAARLSRSDSATLYWTPGQMIAHHTSNGSFLQTGDLLGSGTISGPDDTSLGSLLEITRGGSQPFKLPSGEERGFLEDGDELTLSGFCERPGFARIGFGECRSTILPALPVNKNSPS